MVANYLPSQGDLVWVNLDPARGHEQKGFRPALVVSADEYNKKSSLILLCPITSKTKDYPFEIKLEIEKIKGAVLVDQIRSLDWRSRKIKFIGRISDNSLAEILGKLGLLLRNNFN